MTAHNPFEVSNPEEDDVFDFTNDDTPPRDLSPGDYPSRLIDVTREVSKAGNPMIVFEFVLMTDPTGDPWCAGRSFKLYCAQTEKAMFKTNETLLALGLGKKVGDKVVAKFTKKDAIGKQCVCVIGERPGTGNYADRKFADLKGVKPWTGGGATPFQSSPPDSEEIPF